MRSIRRDEQGFAMLWAVMVSAIAAMLCAVVLTHGSHADRSSGRGRNWEQSLQVAEAGVERAIGVMQGTGAAPAPFTGTESDGTYSVTVTSLGRNRYQIDSAGTKGSVASLETMRSVRVVMAPPKSFKYVLFSLTDVNTKNNDVITGDVWANGSVEVFNNNVVNGSVNAATGMVKLDNGSQVNGDALSGGSVSNVSISNGGTITGNATAASQSPGCTDDPSHLDYKVSGAAAIGGIAKSWGTITGTAGGGNVTPVCIASPATKPMPTFTFNPVNYPSPQTFASPDAFNTYLSSHSSNLAGTFYVNGGDATHYIDLTGVSISGDTTIIAPQAGIDANGVGAANNNDKVLVLISYYNPGSNTACTTNGGNPGDCAIGMKNNFQPNDNTATLIYAPNGPVAFKNNADFNGAVYGNNIVVKNNMNILYDERIEQVVGFGPVTLERESWKEI